MSTVRTSPSPAAGVQAALARPLARRPGGRQNWQEPTLGRKTLIYGALVLFAFPMVIPLVWMVTNSLQTNISSSVWGAGESLAWENYPKAMETMKFSNAMANTIVITAGCMLGQIISCSMVGYGFARFRFRGKNILFMIMLSTMMLPAQVTMIPIFILFRSVGWVDSFLPLIIPAWFASPFFVFMFRQFFSQIPEEILEAARIDGAGNLRIYWQIMLPLSGPVIAIVAIYTFMGTWNDLMGPLIYLNSPENYTLAIALNSFKGQYGTSNATQLLAGSMMTMLPCVLLFFAAQRYFVQSVTASAVKG